MLLRRLLAMVLVPSWLLAGVQIASAQSQGTDANPAYHVLVSEDDVLVLEVRLGHFRASSGILAYTHDNDVFLPLGQLASALELAIQVDVASQVALGWVIEEDRRFALDLGQARVEFDDHVEGIPDAAVYVGYDDIYVRRDVLERWLPVELVVSLSTMRVQVDSQEQLPLIARLERDRIRSRMLTMNHYKPIYPTRRSAYRGWMWPQIDTTVRSQSSGDERRGDLSILARGDLARVSATGFFRGRTTENEKVDGWMNFEREDPDRSLLGPLGSSRVIFGDVFSPALSLVGSGRRGRGVRISNESLDPQRFDVTDVTGSANPGWDAELYVNGRLTAFSVVDEDGRYDFQDVPVYAGRNTMRVVLYGPEGQKRENVHRFNSGPNLGAAGRLRYDVFALQDGLSIFGSELTGGLAGTRGDWIHHVGLDYGVSERLDTSIAIDRTPIGSETADILSLRLNQSTGGSLWQLAYLDDLQRGYMARVGLNTYLLRHDVLALASMSDEYRGVGQGVAQNDRWRGSLRLSRRQPSVHWLESFGYELGLSHRQLTSSDLSSISAMNFRAYARTGRVSHSHRTTIQRSDSRTLGSRVGLIGTQLASGGLGRYRIRGTLDYRIDEGFNLRSTSVSVTRLWGTQLTTQVALTRQFTDPARERLESTLSWRNDSAVVGLRASSDFDGALRWSVTVTTALSIDPRLHDWEVSGRSATRTGSAMARTFIDHDDDGRFSEADEPLEGIVFARNRNWKNNPTDAEGEAWLTGIQPLRPVNVELDMASVFDPFLVPKYEGLTTFVHRGGLVDLEFPFMYVGDIEGTVYRDLLQQDPFPGVGLELLNPAGERVATAVSEFDGYYVFQQVPPGPYKIRIVPTTLHHGDFIIPPAEPVVVPNRGDYVLGPVFVLVREGERLDLKFARDGSLEGDVPPQLVRGDSSETLIARIREMLQNLEDPPTIDELISDPSLTDEERRTLRILHELFYGSDDDYWLAR